MGKKGRSLFRNLSCFSHEGRKKDVLVLSLILFVCVLVLFNMVSIYFFSIPFSPVAITGRAVDTGLIRLYVEGSPRVITIYPENTTYDNDTYTCSGAGDIGKCDDFRYVLDLNVSADFFVDMGAGKGWKYSLYDLEHSVYIKEDEDFTPNISAVRWGNLLTVSAYEEDIGWQSQDVVFTVEVPNSSPLLGPIDDKIFVCEGERLNQKFNVSDVDEKFLKPTIVPTNPLYIDYDSPRTSGYNISLFKIVGLLDKKSDVGEYIETVYVVDPTGLPDSAVTNITVMEINNAPVINNPLRTQTTVVYLNGTDSSFNYQVDVTDTEVDLGEGSLTFNLSWSEDEDLFDINSSTGIMNYTPPEGMLGLPINYHLTMCVNDTALISSHENFSICEDRGFSNESISVCDSFTLTITNENRAPVIVANSPSSPFTVGGTTATVFNASVSDGDMVNAYPDLDWYVNGVLKESNENKSSDIYSWSAGCGNSGAYNVSAITSDGLLGGLVSWNVTVTNVACPVAPSGGSGGGGGGGGGTLAGYCRENWVCNAWQVCQNVERSFIGKSLSPEDYYGFKELCAQNQYDDRFCGFQITSCQDLELCNSTSPKIPRPSEMRTCYFTENPNCIDGITNCHDGSCELLVDCGGPCKPCPTCSDGKQNQGEGGIDCGGPCPYSCEVEEAFKGISFMIIGLLVIAVIILGFILVKLVKIVYHLFIVGKKRKNKRKV